MPMRDVDDGSGSCGRGGGRSAWFLSRKRTPGAMFMPLRVT
jgi:hypothetical protein